MSTSTGAPFLDASSSIAKWEYLNLFKCSELSMLLWNANSLANREQGLVRSSCFILVLEHLDSHSLIGSLNEFNGSNEKCRLTAEDLVTVWKNQSYKERLNRLSQCCICLPIHQQWHSHHTFCHLGYFQELDMNSC